MTPRIDTCLAILVTHRAVIHVVGGSGRTGWETDNGNPVHGLGRKTMDSMTRQGLATCSVTPKGCLRFEPTSKGVEHFKTPPTQAALDAAAEARDEARARRHFGPDVDLSKRPCGDGRACNNGTLPPTAGPMVRFCPICLNRRRNESKAANRRATRRQRARERERAA